MLRPLYKLYYFASLTTSIPASCARYSVGATPTFKTKAFYFTITLYILKYFALLQAITRIINLYVVTTSLASSFTRNRSGPRTLV